MITTRVLANTSITPHKPLSIRMDRWEWMYLWGLNSKEFISESNRDNKKGYFFLLGFHPFQKWNPP